jgi:TolA-binding protein
MRNRLFETCPTVFAVTIMLCLPASVSPQAPTPIPPGHTAANKATRNAENVEPPAQPVQNVTAAQVLQQADELVSLSQQVRADTERATTQGLLAKDLKDKLKRIEKLSKRLREELTP